MALDSCPKCSRYIENSLPECPYCGHRLWHVGKKAGSLILFAVVVAIVFAGSFYWAPSSFNIASWIRLPVTKADEQQPLLTTASVTNIRAQPAISAAIIGKNQPGDAVLELGVMGDWTQVRFGEGGIGFIYTALLKPLSTSPWLAGTDIGHCDDGRDRPGGFYYQVTANQVNLRSGPGIFYKVLRDDGHTNHPLVQLDSSMRVIVECVDGAWSRVRVVNPERLAPSHYGWVSRRYLLALREDGLPQSRIGPSALAAYGKKSFPERAGEFASRLPDIERMRREASTQLLERGQCFRVDSTELSTRSTVDNLVIMVDCRNGRRFYFNEHELLLAEARSQK